MLLSNGFSWNHDKLGFKYFQMIQKKGVSSAHTAGVCVNTVLKLWKKLMSLIPSIGESQPDSELLMILSGN